MEAKKGGDTTKTTLDTSKKKVLEPDFKPRIPLKPLKPLLFEIYACEKK